MQLDIAALAALVEADGALATLKPHFEPRESQLKMLTLTATGLVDNRIVAAEAGTGVGKSLAYLIPALAWSSACDERVVVATATINLQHQLIRSDIPLARRLLKNDSFFLLLKGRSNYLCPTRLRERVEQDSLLAEADGVTRRLAEWGKAQIDSNAVGDRADMPFAVDNELWAQVNADANACPAARCRMQETCLLARLRARARAAKLLIVNHHLLFSDLIARHENDAYEEDVVLPRFQRVIIDEAHAIEQSATSCFSAQLSRTAIERLVARLQRHSGTRAQGLLPRLAGHYGLRIDDVAQQITNINAQAATVDTLAAAMTPAHGSLRLTAAVEGFAPLGDALQELGDRLRGLGGALARIIERVPETARNEPPADELALVAGQLDSYAELADQLRLWQTTPEYIFWFRRARYTTLTRTPLDIGPLLRDALYTPYRSVILTSATLTSGGTFDHWFKRVGLDESLADRITSASLPSHFDYANRVLVGIPTDAPPPTNSSDYADFVATFVRQAVSIADGGALVLFTSYALLKQVSDACRTELAELDIPLLCQGDDDRSRLLERFNREQRSALFATNSFWEGIDAPGETLRLVVITRLPFSVPDDPILIARIEALEQGGGNGFLEMTLPEAIIRLRQGFGRLMRATRDYGAVLITDSRIVQRSYGRLFLKSLPPTASSIAPTDQVMTALERFLFDRTLHS